jgi:hypothetical protein
MTNHLRDVPKLEALGVLSLQHTVTNVSVGWLFSAFPRLKGPYCFPKWAAVTTVYRISEESHPILRIWEYHVWGFCRYLFCPPAWIEPCDLVDPRGV